ncbi:MAG: hypothetical protein AB2A00_37680 [Myxococcota bacterium]
MTTFARWVSVSLLLLGACGGAPEECTTAEATTDQFCVPATAEAQQALTLQARPTGCSNVCNGTVEFQCEVVVQGTVITLGLSRTECVEEQRPQPPFMSSSECTLACAIPDPVACNVPALAAGTYTVRAEGAADQTLEVASGGATQCTVGSL